MLCPCKVQLLALHETELCLHMPSACNGLHVKALCCFCINFFAYIVTFCCHVMQAK